MTKKLLSIAQIMTASPVIPVIVIDDIEDAVPLAQALVNGGLTVLEITLRTSAGLEAIRRVKQDVSGAIVGAGTVLNAGDVSDAVSAGAEFLVSPGCTAGLLEAAALTNVPLLPGIATPSEAMAVLASGITHMKFFPAEAAGSIPMLKSIAGPLPQIKFCPTGGVNEVIAPNYLSLDNVYCVGGTWMLDKKLIAVKDWAGIERLAAVAASL